MPALILKRASASRPTGEWNDDDFDVLADGVMVGRIMKAAAGIARYFLAYEPDKERAIELVRKRVPVYEGEVAEAVTEVTANELLGQRMRPGDVRQRG